ncbi:MAG TPA: KpsF/GutQ family sugar-phosphate isomerase [Alphaproteobacteria bacterium]|nr:KpsF/GutQ family sugar-phosphate isomerase [Alphaproteobacteria bacterium]
MTAAQKPCRESRVKHADLMVGRRVLEVEGRALLKLEEAIGESFTTAVERLSGITGRVVFTGMGKSGHIGRKLAATMASTGTPSFFVHPAEASHGDLGMITRQDAVLALSNSGETAELSDIIQYTRRFNIPLIAVVGQEDSSLGDNADIAIVLPDCPEACPMGLTPTTSTTMTLALGDAMAVALLERASFTSSKFQELHPGGNIGQRLVTVNAVMHTGDSMPLVRDKVSMAEAILAMTGKAFGCVGVTDNGNQLVGIVTDGDLRRHMANDLLVREVSDVMTLSPKVIRANALAAEALWIMNESAITSLFVTEQGEPQGIIHVHDCLRAEVA